MPRFEVNTWVRNTKTGTLGMVVACFTTIGKRPRCVVEVKPISYGYGSKTAYWSAANVEAE